MRELSELLADSVDARARSVAGLTPDQGDFDTIVKTVRRRRVVRRSLQTLAVVPIVGGLAAGAYLGADLLRDAPIDPAASPSEVVTTPTPTADTPDPGTLDKGALVTEEGLPPFYEAPANLLDHVGDGWVALHYRPQGASNTTGQEEPLSNAIFLASPDGELFRAVELPLDLDVQIEAWDPASPRVRVLWPEPEGSDRIVTIGWIDLATEDVIEDDVQFADWARLLGHDHAGSELWVEEVVENDVYQGGSLWSIAPDGSRRVVAKVPTTWGVVDPSGRQLLVDQPDPADGIVVVDLDSGELREVAIAMKGRTCELVGWYDATSVAVLCHDPVSDDAVAAMDRIDYVAQNAGLFRVETVADGEPTLLYTFAEGDPVPETWTGHRVGDSIAYVVSSGFPHGCSMGVALWDGQAPPRMAVDGSATQTNIFWLRTTTAGQLLALGSLSCETNGVQAQVWSVDAATGATTTLAPWIDAEQASGRDYWARTVTSMAG